MKWKNTQLNNGTLLSAPPSSRVDGLQKRKKPQGKLETHISQQR